MLTSSGSTGGRGDAKTIIAPNTSFGDIIKEGPVHMFSDADFKLLNKK